jgi:hypothetical protein
LQKKALAKAKEAAKEALAKTHEVESETNEAEEATKVTNDMMKAGFQADLEKAMKAVEDAKGAMTAASSQMFTFYSNLLSLESKYLWNKIVREQTESNLLLNLQEYNLKAQGECLASCLTIVSCFTFLLHSPSTQLSKKSTTSQMYLRSPSASTYISLYVV